jgi:hypothetical protein
MRGWGGVGWGYMRVCYISIYLKRGKVDRQRVRGLSLHFLRVFSPTMLPYPDGYFASSKIISRGSIGPAWPSYYQSGLI